MWSTELWKTETLSGDLEEVQIIIIVVLRHHLPLCCVDIHSDGTKVMVGFTAGASAHMKAVWLSCASSHPSKQNHPL